MNFYINEADKLMLKAKNKPFSVGRVLKIMVFSSACLQIANGLDRGK
jgi:hypothetical protein